MIEPRFRTAWGKSEEVLPSLPDASVDSLVCDPPAGISFMGKDWDCFRRKHNPADVGRDNVFGRMSAHAPHSYGESDRGRFIAFLTPIFQECLRVLKPGAYGLVWALPRTSHWTATALEDAGFEVRDVVNHFFAQGMPKSHNIGKAIDAMLGAEREVIGFESTASTILKPGRGVSGICSAGSPAGEYVGERKHLPITVPATSEAAQWDGWGTALKPAAEHWILVRRPLEQGTVAANVLAHGTGALNIDASRIGRAADDVPGWHASGAKGSEGFQGTDTFKIHEMSPEEVQARCGGKGRWPANVVLSHDERCVLVGSRRVKGCPAQVVQGGKDGGGFDVGSSDGTRHTVFQGYGDEEGMEECDLYACVPGCPVRLLDDSVAPSRSRKGKPRRSKKSGEGWGATATGAEYNDRGGPSRFFYCAKASKRERNEGLQPLLQLRDDLSSEQREYVFSELRKVGVKL